jgi:hypothetical protein
VGDGAGRWAWHGIPVSGSVLSDPNHADVMIVHAGRSWPGVEFRARTGARLVMICHNASEAVRDDLDGAHPDLIVVNSESMALDLDVDALVINPPAPTPSPHSIGDHVTMLSLNELKGGPQLWALADRMPDVSFLAIHGGYGKQLDADVDNVTVLGHVPHDQLGTEVWKRTAVFLQLSSSESWGMAAAEAIAHGIPVVAHPTPGIVENLGEAAVYVDRDDLAGIEAAVRGILTDPAPRVEAARRRALEHEETSARQLTDWVTAIERLGDEANQRNRATAGVHAGR